MVAGLEAAEFPREGNKTAFHGLPVRLQWQLWIEVGGWKLKEREDQGEYLVRVELGEDGHYYKLETEAGGRKKGLTPPPRQLFDAYQPRKERLRVSIVRLQKKNGKTEQIDAGYCLVALKDLQANKPKLGWVTVKTVTRDEKGRRTPIGSVQVNMKLSSSMKAAVLCLVDMREKEVLFYQNVNTLADLNPVFVEPSMTPFFWKMESSGSIQRCRVRNSQKRELAVLERKVVQGTVLVEIVKPLEEEYWQCSLTEDCNELCYRVDGSWNGMISETLVSKQVTTFELKVKGDIVARAECRNPRDIKLSVDAPSQDPLDSILLMIGTKMMEKK